MKRTNIALILMTVLVLALVFAGCTAEEQQAAVAAAESVAESAGTTLEEVGAVAADTAAQVADAVTDLDDYAYIKAKGKLIVGYTVYEPMNYFDAAGNFVGFDTDFAKAVCAKLGVEPEFVEINWDTKEVELAAKSIDCIWNGLTVTEERKANMAFSKSYIKNMQVAVIRTADAGTYTDAASMSAANLVAEVSSAGESAIKDDENLSKGNYVAVPKQTDALLEVKSGTADVAILDYVLAKAMVGEGTDYADLQIVEGLEFAAEEYAIGFRLDSSMVAKVDEAIDALIADGSLQKIAETYEQGTVLLANQ